MNPLKAATKQALVGTAVAAAALALAACGDDDSGGDSTDADSAAGAPVSAQTIEGQDVLATSEGEAVYVSDQETGGEIVCTEGCLAIWKPVTAQGESASDLGGDFGVATRPDGGRQVTFNGQPLYTFTEEGPGEVTGDGVVDTFGGQQFTWQVATEDGGSSTGSTSPTETSSSDDSDGGGGLGY